MVDNLVLSVFCGADLLGRAFTEAGYCVVHGGDPMFGQVGVETLHPPAGAFEGIIGGPPCQRWAQSHNLCGDKTAHPNLVPEFERIVAEAQPRWFLMECVTGAPIPVVAGYHIVSKSIYAWELGNPQRRLRRFSFGSRPPLVILWPHGERPPKGALTRGMTRPTMPLIETEDGQQKNLYSLTGSPRVHVDRNGRKVYPTPCGTNSTQRMRLGEKAIRGLGIPGKTTFTLDDYRYGFGLPPSWDAPALLKAYKFKVLGNSVPMQVGRALAEAVKLATRNKVVAKEMRL